MPLLLANSMSPVMWQTLTLLYFGNAAIGLIEGAVLARVFRFPPVRTIGLMIVANYCSMGVGVLLFGLGEAPSPVPEMLFNVPLHHAGAIVWLCVAIAFLASVVVEWPFCWAASHLGKVSWRRSVYAAVLAQVVTYPMLFLFFANSTNTIGKSVYVAPLAEVVPESLRGRAATVYFIGADDGALYSIALDGSGLTKLRDLGARGRHEVLGWLPPDEASGAGWRLVHDYEWGEHKVLMENPDGRCDAFRSEYGDHAQRGGWWLGHEGVADLRAPEEREWKCRPRGNWGVECECEATSERLAVTFDTPFVSWWGRCVTILPGVPGDVVVFELGKQVCVLSPGTGKVAFLARGRGPVVVVRKTESSETERPLDDGR